MDASIPTGWLDFSERLAAHNVLVPMRAMGLYGMGPAFTDAYDALNSAVSRLGSTAEFESYRFPTILPRSDFEKTDYLRSFPHLTGALHGFEGGTAEHGQLLASLESGLSWSDHLSPTDFMMTPAACYPLYTVCADRLAAGQRRFEVVGGCFRNEPSQDPARMCAFHMHEFVAIDEPTVVSSFRDDWIGRAMTLFADLELSVDLVPANDPFFGRAGRLLAASQRENELKLEAVTPIADPANRTAIASFNLHLDHLSSAFGISAGDGETHSACVGFGLERIVLSLFSTHGIDVAKWPQSTLNALDL